MTSMFQTVCTVIDDSTYGHKSRLKNAFLSCYIFDFLAALPREELHQSLIGFYGEYIILSAFYLITLMLCKQVWLEYQVCRSHPILCWQPSKLAAWISYNHGHDQGIPPKGCLKWTVGKLITILAKQPSPQPLLQRTASDILLHSVEV
jgi:hypothetical protein